VELKSRELAEKIVLKNLNATDENNRMTEDELQKEIEDFAREIQKEIPKSLWD